jgi:hypothetical protein
VKKGDAAGQTIREGGQLAVDAPGCSSAQSVRARYAGRHGAGGRRLLRGFPLGLPHPQGGLEKSHYRAGFRLHVRLHGDFLLAGVQRSQVGLPLDMQIAG